MNNQNGESPKRIPIGRFMHEMTDGLYSRERWKGNEEPFYRRQSVLHHTLEALILAKVIIDLEIKHGNPCGINPYRLLGMVLVHDMAERHLDDVIQPIKCARPRIRELYEELEFELFMAMAGELPEVLTEGLIESFKDAVDATGGADKRLFDAIEQLGYVIDAFEAVAKGKTDYVGVFARHWEIIAKAAQEFVSIRIVSDDYKGAVQQLLSRHKPSQLTLSLR